MVRLHILAAYFAIALMFQASCNASCILEHQPASVNPVSEAPACHHPADQPSTPSGELPENCEHRQSLEASAPQVKPSIMMAGMPAMIPGAVFTY
jgi:hypothetical protein